MSYRIGLEERSGGLEERSAGLVANSPSEATVVENDVGASSPCSTTISSNV